MTDEVYTIGHSTHTIAKFIELIRMNSIDVVCDVRSRPYSRMNPQFNRESLKEALKESGVKYVFLGFELGARSEDKTCYRHGQVQYDLLAETMLFKGGISRVEEGAHKFRVALMCAEKEPLDCHRTILVGRRLVEDGLAVKHILADGTVEEHSHTLQRLVSRLRMQRADMFRSEEAVVREAYELQGREIAYREDVATSSGDAGLSA